MPGRELTDIIAAAPLISPVTGLENMLAIDENGDLGKIDPDNIGREALAEDRQFFVDPILGDDDNTGTSLSPFQTLPYAVIHACTRIDMRDHDMDIKLVDGTHDGEVRLPNWFGQPPLGYVSITGHAGDPEAVRVTNTGAPSLYNNFWTFGPTNHWHGGHFTIAPNTGIGIFLDGNDDFTGESIVFDFSTNFCQGVWAQYATSAVFTNTRIIGSGTNEILGSAHWQSGIAFKGTTTIDDTPSFLAYVYGRDQSNINIFGSLVDGGATGNSGGVTRCSSLTSTYVLPGTFDPVGEIDGTSVAIINGVTYGGGQPVTVKAGAVTTADVAAGTSRVIKDSSGGTVKLYCNNGGVLIAVALT